MTSIIFVTHASNEARAELARKSFVSLKKSIPQGCQVIVVDNGGEYSNADFFIKQDIAHYIKNGENIHFGLARNIGFKLATEKYTAVVDDDLIYQEGWLEKCVDVLEKTTGKYFATPIGRIKTHNRDAFNRGTLNIDGTDYILNTFAGSNCWVMKTDDFRELGEFPKHIFAGTKWCQSYSRKGYVVIVLPEIMVEHIGQRNTPYEGHYEVLKKTVK